MKAAIALVLYVLSLCGIDVNNETRIDRIRSNGTDVLYSRVVARPNGTRFECLRSASGQCYYTVYARDCDAPARPVNGRLDCASVDRFALALGDARQMAARPGLRMCVSADPHAPADCDASDAIALQ